MPITGEVILQRVSEIYPAPTLNPDTGMPYTDPALGPLWTPTSVVSGGWGRPQIVVNGQDVTYFRGHATLLGTMVWNEPFGDDTLDLIFGAIGPWDTPGTGVLAWLVDGCDVEIYKVLPDGTAERTNPMFEGRYLARDTNTPYQRAGASNAGAHAEGTETPDFYKTVHCLGAIYAADIEIKTPAFSITADPTLTTVDMGTLIANELNSRSNAGTIHLGSCAPVPTGINLQDKGSGTQLINGYVQDLLGQGSVAPTPSPGSAVVGIVARPDGKGYLVTAQDGTVIAFQIRTPYFGSMVGRPLNAAISGMAATSDGLGYWLCAEDGGVFAFGDAVFAGEEAAPTSTVIGMAGHGTGGYWLLDDTGHVYTFGTAAYHGGGAGTSLMVGIAATPTGLGYYLCDLSGHVYAYGDAVFAGNGASAHPYVGIAARPAGGYWLCDDHGNVEGFGGAVSLGVPPSPLQAPMSSIVAQGNGGYWTAAQDGGVFAYGTAPFQGSIPGNSGVWQGWTLAKLPGRIPSVQLKNRWRADFTFRAGQPGLQLSLSTDFTLATKSIFGNGTDASGHAWANSKYPNLRPINPPIWPGVILSLGVTHSSVLTWTQAMHDAGWALTPTSTFDGTCQTVCRAFQVANGLLVTGTVAAQTWAATFVTGSNSGDLTAAYLAPLAEVPQVEPFLYDAFGAKAGPNPLFDYDLPRVERWETFGAHVDKASAMQSALAEIGRDSIAGVTGTMTAYADPQEMSRYDTRAGMNCRLLDYEGLGTETMLHVAQASLAWNTQGRPMTYTVDTNARDLITVAAIRTRDRSTTDPVRRIRHSRRASRIVPDVAVPWDFEAGGGIIPRFILQAGLWSVIRIPASEAGTVVEASLTTDTPATQFAVAVFSAPTTPAFIASLVPDPLTSSNWTTNLPASANCVIAWGQQGDRCGYSPLQEGATGAVLNGKFDDVGSWSFISLVPPWLWVALYADVQTTISGRLYPEPIFSQ